MLGVCSAFCAAALSGLWFPKILSTALKINRRWWATKRSSYRFQHSPLPAIPQLRFSLPQ